MTPQPAHASGDTEAEITTVFLLTDGDVLAQEAGTRLWRSVAAPSGGQPALGPTPAQLRNLKRLHPAYQGRLPRPDPDLQEPARTIEIYDPLTSSWSRVPKGACRTQVGETVFCTLPDGRYLVGGPSTAACATFDPGTNRWSTSPVPGPRPVQGRRRPSAASVIAVRMSN